jgi:hypothetical protein
MVAAPYTERRDRRRPHTDFVFLPITSFERAEAFVEWDGIDLIEVRDGRICRNAVYSSAHAARVLGQPA